LLRQVHVVERLHVVHHRAHLERNSGPAESGRPVAGVDQLVASRRLRVLRLTPTCRSSRTGRLHHGLHCPPGWPAGKMLHTARRPYGSAARTRPVGDHILHLRLRLDIRGKPARPASLPAHAFSRPDLDWTSGALTICRFCPTRALSSTGRDRATLRPTKTSWPVRVYAPCRGSKGRMSPHFQLTAGRDSERRERQTCNHAEESPVRN